MKKILIILIVLTCFTLKIKEAHASLYKELDFWTLHSAPIFPDEPIEGYYLARIDQSYIDELTAIKEITISPDMYVPLDTINDDYKLLYIDYQNQPAFFTIIKIEFSSLCVHIRNNDGEYLYSKDYPYDTEPIISGENITTFLSDNYSISTLIENIKAYDYKDGDISYKLTVIHDTYTKDRTEGTKEVTVQVKDSNSNQASKTFEIYVIDDKDPLITSNPIYVSDTYLLTEEIIKESIIATDYLGESFDVNIDCTTYTKNSTIQNTYQFTISGIDQFGREITSTEDIIVLKSDYSFYSLNKKSLSFNTYIDFKENDFLYFFNIFNEINILNHNIEVYQETNDSYNVFYEIESSDGFEEFRMNYSFENINQITNQDPTSNISIAIKIICIILITSTISFHLITFVLQKKKLFK